jgi:hypothetical protein
MKTCLRTVTPLVVMFGALGSGRAEAQSGILGPNTYADVPFNQGSLFYRPSGARSSSSMLRPAPKNASNPTRGRFFRRRLGRPVTAPNTYGLQPWRGWSR